MTQTRPLDVTRSGETLVPKQRWLFDRLFVEGQDYTIEIHEPRSTKSHNHYFAAIHEAWKNLPEEASKQHPDSEHLRKWALIKCGWSIKRNVVCETVEMAHQVAAIAGQLNESAVIVVQGPVVTIATARTQKTTGPNKMDREEFQKSKQDVLDYVADMIGVDSATLSSQVSDSSDAPANRDRTNTPAAGGPHIDPSAGVSNSNSSGGPADTPAATGSPDNNPPAAGANPSDHPSALVDGWFDIYVQILTRSNNRALAVQHRDEIAQSKIGRPNDLEREVQREIATLVNRRDRAKITGSEFQDGIAAIRSRWTSGKRHG